VGRAPTAQIRLVDEGISREHAEILVEGDRVIVKDLSSTNGTFVNGARTSSREVRAGDQVQIGGATLVVFTHTDGLESARGAGTPSASSPSPTIQRDAFIARVAEEIAYARRHVEPISVLTWSFADEDGLAARLGPGGFRALVDAARAAASGVLRPGDLLAATGPGRFAALLRRATVADGAELGRELATAVASAVATDDVLVALRVGVAGPTSPNAKPLAAASAALRDAETALSTAHKRGAIVVASS
jgi:predicted component of type VI protein secretion system